MEWIILLKDNPDGVLMQNTAPTESIALTMFLRIDGFRILKFANICAKLDRLDKSPRTIDLNEILLDQTWFDLSHSHHLQKL
jgi:hypothetical protein